MPDLVDRCGARFHRRAPGVVECTDRFDGLALRDRGDPTRLCWSGSEVRVDGVGLADTAACGAVGSCDIDDGVAVCPDGAGKPGAVEAGVLDADQFDPSVAADEIEGMSVTSCCGGEFGVAEVATLFVDDGDADGVGVGVDAGDNLLASGGACASCWTRVAETLDTRARSAPTRKGQLTRARILDAAREELAERGYFSSTVAQIAARSGLALGSLYRYFGNKDEIFLELLEELVEDLYSSVAGSWVKGEERQSLRESSLRYLTTYHANRHLIGGLLEMSAAVPVCADLWWELRQKTFHRKSVYLRRALSDNSLRPDDAAAALGTMVEQLAYHW